MGKRCGMLRRVRGECFEGLVVNSGLMNSVAAPCISPRALKQMVRRAVPGSSAVWAVSTLPGIHLQLGNLTKAKQIYPLRYYSYCFNKGLQQTHQSYHPE